MKRMHSLVCALLLATGVAQAETWNIDANHTRVGFSVSHMVVSSVEGRFHDVKGAIDIDEKDATKSSVDLLIAAGSIDTENEKRDGHLKSPDFLDVAKYPNITFKSTKVARLTKNKFKVTGDLTIRNVKKSLTLDVSLSEPMTDPWGKSVRAARVEGKLNRRDYGLNWNKALDKGGVLVGDEIALNIQFELNK
jgi:polyisoprenoid-binding protein YceI